MANIRIDLNHAPLDGETVSFKAPCNASDITGLVIYYQNESNQTVSKEFTLNDANGGDIGVLDNVFAEGAIVKVILDTDQSNAFVQNPDTNTYLEGRFDGKADKNHTHTAAGVGAVPTTRKVNNKALSADISLTASDVGARPSTWTPSASDVGARPDTWMPTAAEVGAVALNGTNVMTGSLHTTADGVGMGSFFATQHGAYVEGGQQDKTAYRQLFIAAPQSRPNVADALSFATIENGEFRDVSIVLHTGNIAQYVPEGVKIQTGSYVGTGVYNTGNENRLTFNFVPKFLVISGHRNQPQNLGGSSMAFILYDELIRFNGGTFASFITNAGSDCYKEYYSLSNANKTLTWWNESSASGQMNNADVVYHYMAIG